MIFYLRTFFITIGVLFFYKANCYGQQNIERWGRFEIEFKHSEKKNPFDNNISATFSLNNESIVVRGFYDGNDSYKVRFMPTQTGLWKYTTSSNIESMNNQSGSFISIEPTKKNNHGMVVVDGKHHFKYNDGKRYYPIGTTAYAWTHMGLDVQKETLKSLEVSAFNKIRMCVFPKDYMHVKDNPELFPFEIKKTEKNKEGKEIKVWDYQRFNPSFFQHLEKCIDQLALLNIESDLILFHPYDKGRWGFDSMPNDVNVRYIEYITARLSSFRNIWWSLANEWDYVKSKTISDWDMLSQTVVDNDPYGHLCSIHGSTATYYDYWKPMFTHVSVQDEAPVLSAVSSATLRNVFNKPVVLDEVGYEGNLTNRWGRWSPQKMVSLFLNGVMGGVYVTHGECYKIEDNPIFWAQGELFQGDSWQRIKFIRTLMEEAPNPIEMSDISRDFVTSTAGEGYYFIHFDENIQSEWLFNLPEKNANYNKLKEGQSFKVDIINVWDMTIIEYPTIFKTSKPTDYRVYDEKLQKVRLPETPYILLRITEVE